MEFPWASQPMNLFVILGMANMQARNDEMLFFPSYYTDEKNPFFLIFQCMPRCAAIKVISCNLVGFKK